MKGGLLTLVTILGFMAGGTGFSFAIGAWDGNAAIRGNAAISLMILLGTGLQMRIAFSLIECNDLEAAAIWRRKIDHCERIGKPN